MILRFTLAIDRGRVEVVDTMLNGIVYLFVDHLLVVVILVLCLRRQSHHTIAKQGDLLLRLGVDTIGHLTYWWFYLFGIFADRLDVFS